MFVDGLLQLGDYFCQAIEDDLSFPFGDVQGFVDLVAEETIFMDVLAERRATEKVGMEDQRVAFWLMQFPRIAHACDLAGSDEDQGPFLVVIGVFTVMKIPAFDVFQKDGVKAEPGAHEMAGFGFGEVDHADEGMQRFVVVEIVVLADGIESSQLLHIVKGTMPGRLIYDEAAGSAILVGDPVIGIRQVPPLSRNFVVKIALL